MNGNDGFGVIPNLIDQNQRQDLQEQAQKNLELHQQLGMWGYIVNDPDAPPMMKDAAIKHTLGTVEKHGGKEAKQMLPKLENYLQNLVMGPVQARAMVQLAPGLAQLAGQGLVGGGPQNVQTPQRFAYTPPDPGDAAPGFRPATDADYAAAGQVPPTGFRPATAEEKAAQQTSPATPATLATGAAAQGWPTAEEQAAAAAPPGHPHHGFFRKLLTGVERFGEALGYQTPERQIQLREQVANADTQNRINQIRRFYNSPTTVAEFQRAGLTPRDLAEAQINAMNTAFNVKPVTERMAAPLLATNQETGRTMTLFPTAGNNIDLDPNTAEQLGLPAEYAGQKMSLQQLQGLLPKWTLGKLGTSGAGKMSELDKQTSYFISSGVEKDPAKARQRAAQLLLDKARIQAGDVDQMKPEDMITSAQYALAGGKDPPFGYGAAGVKARQQYYAVKAQLARGVGIDNIIAGQFDIKGKGKSIQDLNQMKGRLESYEKTAKRNIQNFLNSAEDIPDTGIPWLNKPVRDAEAALAGDPGVAVFRAARQIAMVELARITNQPDLKGALSDHARKEIDELNPESMTLNQIKAVMRLLVNDMENRPKGLDAEIKEMQKGVKETTRKITGTGGGAAAGAGAGAAGGAGGGGGATEEIPDTKDPNEDEIRGLVKPR